MPVKRTTSAELQFLADNEEWYICRVEDVRLTARENLARVVEANTWIEEHCEPNEAFRFGGLFYFKHKEDHTQFTLIWS